MSIKPYKQIVFFIFLNIFFANGKEMPVRLKISFQQGMEPSIKYNTYNSDSLKNYHWNLIKNIYENFLSNFSYSDNPRIPKIIHQIWLGSPLPERYKQFQATWKKNHSDWRYKLWTDKDIEDFGLYNKKIYDKATNYGEKSDIARYEILYREGGLYVDTDCECMQCFDILNHSLDFYAGIVFQNDVRINNALIGAIPGHSILKNCIEQMQQKPKTLPNMTHAGMKATMTYTGPIFFTQKILNYLEQSNDKRIVLFPNTFFYPLSPFQDTINNFKDAKPWLKNETLAIHYGDGTWIKNNKKTHNKNNKRKTW